MRYLLPILFICANSLYSQDLQDIYWPSQEPDSQKLVFETFTAIEVERLNDSLFIRREYEGPGQLYIEAITKQEYRVDSFYYEDEETEEVKQKIDSGFVDYFAGKFTTYHKNGHKFESGSIINGLKEGKWETTDSNGVKRVTCHYFNGQLIGRFDRYYPNGKMECSGEFVHISKDVTYIPRRSYEPSSTQITNVPAKHGNWYYFDQEGKKVETQKWYMGERIDVSIYFPEY